MKLVKHSELCNMAPGTVFLADGYDRITVMESGAGMNPPYRDFFYITAAGAYDVREQGEEAKTLHETGRVDIVDPIVGGRDGLFEDEAEYFVFESLDEFHRYAHIQSILPYCIPKHLKGPTQAQMAEEDLKIDEYYCMDGNVAMGRLVHIGHEFGQPDHKVIHLEVVDCNPLYFSAAIQTMPMERFLAQFHHFNTDTVKEIVAQNPVVVEVADKMKSKIDAHVAKKD